MGAHGVEVPAELILASDGVDAWDVVDALVEVHADEGVGCDLQVGPAEIPVALLRFFDGLHAEANGCLSYNGIMRD